MSLTHHDGIAVYGSGFMIGKQGGETLVIGLSGYVEPGRLKYADGTAGLKVDGGTVGFSGWFLRSQSTALSTITTIVANVDRNTYGQPVHTSGGKSLIETTFSGHCYDIYKFVMLSGSAVGGVAGISSGQTSSKINWMAIGT